MTAPPRAADSAQSPHSPEPVRPVKPIRPDDGLDYSAIDPPAFGETVEIVPGVQWLRMPVPFALEHINLWMLEDVHPATGAPAWTLVDSGIGSNTTQALWRALFDGSAGLRKPWRLITTHYHPDHFGLAGWLSEQYGCELWMTEAEWLTGTLLWRIPEDEWVESQDRFFARHGLSDDIRAYHLKGGQKYREGVRRPPESVRQIRDGERIAINGKHWRVTTAKGHAADLATLWNETDGVLISGDQILPQISPIVPVWWYRAGMRPLGDFLRNFDKFAALPAETLILPSHRQPFRGVHDRIAQIRAHHADRLDAVARHLAEHGSSTAAHASLAIFPHAQDAMNMLFALGETIAHLEHLVETGRADRHDDGAALTYSPI
ncbi:MAG: MBL fold metallo-hydrolase [Alphaproteobacteria bacterium]|nr:MBL fold metallo-hydrolase [Alphaproteobacteria bacterium]